MASIDLQATNENDFEEHLLSFPSMTPTFPGQSRKKMGSGKMEIRVSSLPQSSRQSVEELKLLDLDSDGALLDEEEIVMAVDNLTSKTKDNNAGFKNLAWILFAVLILVGCVFGATVAFCSFLGGLICYVQIATHVRLAKDTEAVSDMSNYELDALKIVKLSGGDVKFQVKGYARSMAMDKVTLLVEGGTITYDDSGILNATGDAKELLEFAYGEELETVEECCNRRPFSARRR